MSTLPLSKKIIGIAAAVVLLVAALSPFWTVLLIKRQANAIVGDSLTGLVASTLANASTTESFIETAMAIATPNAEARRTLLAETMEVSHETDVQLEAYAAAIKDDLDRVIYRHVMESRQTYRKNRDQVIALLNAGRLDEAHDLFNTVALPQFRAYNNALHQLLTYNTTKAKDRGHDILVWCNSLLVAQALLIVFFLIYSFFSPLALIIESLSRPGNDTSEI